MKKQIVDSLRSLERLHGITILYAVESGSRAWGFESQDSDWDVRFIYHRPAEMYLAIDSNNLPIEQRDTINVPITSELDISGWDVRKMLQLLKKSNPPLLEWLRSPIIYREDADSIKRLRKLAAAYYSPKACVHHYLHMAQGNFRQYLDRTGDVIRKKYLYVVRPVLAALWILEEGSSAPMEISALLAPLKHSAGQHAPLQAIHRLIDEKRAGVELGRAPKDPVIHAFLRESLKRIESAVNALPPAPEPSSEPLNTYLRWVIKRA